jgi:hypothetical protein
VEFADFENHPIEGIARMGNKPFRVPLLSQIDGNLWQGGCPVGVAPVEFDFIINLYPWEPYRIHDHQIMLVARLYDHGEIPEERLLLPLARHVNQCRVAGPTLVHCQAGLNRSALVAGLALIEAGMPAQDAVNLLREKRCDAVLCNQAFEGWLLRRVRAERRKAA